MGSVLGSRLPPSNHLPMMHQWLTIRCQIINRFILFLTLKVSLSVLGRTLESRRSINVHYKCTQKLSGPEAQALYQHNMC